MKSRRGMGIATPAFVMALLALYVLLLTLSGCSTSIADYPANVKSFSIPGRPANTALGIVATPPVNVTVYDQQVSYLGEVCGAIVQYTNGEPATVMPGNCQTLVQLLMNSPVNMGMGALFTQAAKAP